MLGQPCNEWDTFIKLDTSCQQVVLNLTVVDNFGQPVRTQFVGVLSTDSLQVVSLLRVLDKEPKLNGRLLIGYICGRVEPKSRD